MEGAGFETLTITSQGTDARIKGRVLGTLPDTVSSNMRMLLVGLNPSLHSVEAGYGFAGPGNRFWPAVTESGLVSKERDPVHALKHHRIGMSDLVKRASTSFSNIGCGVSGRSCATRQALWMAITWSGLRFGNYRLAFCVKQQRPSIG